MRARRTDSNLTAIAEIARRVGFRVNIRNDDLCDIDAQLGSVTELWECKTYELGKRGKPLAARYTDRQKRLRAEGWVIHTVRTADDVLAARERMMR